VLEEQAELSRRNLMCLHKLHELLWLRMRVHTLWMELIEDSEEHDDIMRAYSLPPPPPPSNVALSIPDRQRRMIPGDVAGAHATMLFPALHMKSRNAAAATYLGLSWPVKKDQEQEWHMLAQQKLCRVRDEYLRCRRRVARCRLRRVAEHKERPAPGCFLSHDVIRYGVCLYLPPKERSQAWMLTSKK